MNKKNTNTVNWKGKRRGAVSSLSSMLMPYDMFSQPVTLHYKGRDTYQTPCGGLISILSFSMILAALVHFSSNADFDIDLVRQTQSVEQYQIVAPDSLLEEVKSSKDFANLTLALQFTPVEGRSSDDYAKIDSILDFMQVRQKIRTKKGISYSIDNSQMADQVYRDDNLTAMLSENQHGFFEMRLDTENLKVQGTSDYLKRLNQIVTIFNLELNLDKIKKQIFEDFQDDDFYAFHHISQAKILGDLYNDFSMSYTLSSSERQQKLDDLDFSSGTDKSELIYRYFTDYYTGYDSNGDPYVPLSTLTVYKDYLGDKISEIQDTFDQFKLQLVIYDENEAFGPQGSPAFDYPYQDRKNTLSSHDIWANHKQFQKEKVYLMNTLTCQLNHNQDNQDQNSQQYSELIDQESCDGEILNKVRYDRYQEERYILDDDSAETGARQVFELEVTMSPMVRVNQRKIFQIFVFDFTPLGLLVRQFMQVLVIIIAIYLVGNLVSQQAMIATLCQDLYIVPDLKSTSSSSTKMLAGQADKQRGVYSPFKLSTISLVINKLLCSPISSLTQACTFSRSSFYKIKEGKRRLEKDLDIIRLVKKLRQSEELWSTIINKEQQLLLKYTKASVINQDDDSSDCSDDSETKHPSLNPDKIKLSHHLKMSNSPNSIVQEINLGLINRLSAQSEIKTQIKTNFKEYISQQQSQHEKSRQKIIEDLMNETEDHLLNGSTSRNSLDMSSFCMNISQRIIQKRNGKSIFIQEVDDDVNTLSDDDKNYQGNRLRAGYIDPTEQKSRIMEVRQQLNEVDLGLLTQLRGDLPKEALIKLGDREAARGNNMHQEDASEDIRLYRLVFGVSGCQYPTNMAQIKKELDIMDTSILSELYPEIDGKLLKQLSDRSHNLNKGVQPEDQDDLDLFKNLHRPNGMQRYYPITQSELLTVIQKADLNIIQAVSMNESNDTFNRLKKRQQNGQKGSSEMDDDLKLLTSIRGKGPHQLLRPMSMDDVRRSLDSIRIEVMENTLPFAANDLKQKITQRHQDLIQGSPYDDDQDLNLYQILLQHGCFFNLKTSLTIPELTSYLNRIDHDLMKQIYPNMKDSCSQAIAVRTQFRQKGLELEDSNELDLYTNIQMVDERETLINRQQVSRFIDGLNIDVIEQIYHDKIDLQIIKNLRQRQTDYNCSQNDSDLYCQIMGKNKNHSDRRHPLSSSELKEALDQIDLSVLQLVNPQTSKFFIERLMKRQDKLSKQQSVEMKEEIILYKLFVLQSTRDIPVNLEMVKKKLDEIDPQIVKTLYPQFRPGVLAQLKERMVRPLDEDQEINLYRQFITIVDNSRTRFPINISEASHILKVFESDKYLKNLKSSSEVKNKLKRQITNLVTNNTGDDTKMELGQLSLFKKYMNTDEFKTMIDRYYQQRQEEFDMKYISPEINSLSFERMNLIINELKEKKNKRIDWQIRRHIQQENSNDVIVDLFQLLSLLHPTLITSSPHFLQSLIPNLPDISSHKHLNKNFTPSSLSNKAETQHTTVDKGSSRMKFTQGGSDMQKDSGDVPIIDIQEVWQDDESIVESASLTEEERMLEEVMAATSSNFQKSRKQNHDYIDSAVNNSAQSQIQSFYKLQPLSLERQKYRNQQQRSQYEPEDQSVAENYYSSPSPKPSARHNYEIE